MLLLPLYLDHLGASNETIGIVMAAAAVGGLVGRPLVGWAIDAKGRKPTIVAGTALVVAAMVGILAVRDIGPLIYVDRVVFGLGIGALFTGYFTFAADIVPVERRTEGLALFGISGLIPLIVNPFADEIGVAAPDVRWFLPIVGLVIASSLVFLAPLPEPRGRIPAAPFRVGAVLGALRRRPLWPVWLITGCFSALVATFMAFATVVAARRGVSNPAGIWLTYAVGAAAIRLFGARLPDRVGPSNFVAPSLAIYVVGMLLAASAQTDTAFLLSGLVAGLGHGYAFPILTSQVVSRTPDTMRGSGLAMFTALWEVAILLVTPGLGRFGDAFGDEAMFGLAAVAAVVVLATWLPLEHRYGGEGSRNGEAFVGDATVTEEV